MKGNNPTYPTDFDIVQGNKVSSDYVQDAIDALSGEEYGVSRCGDAVVVKCGDVWVVYENGYCFITDTVHYK